MDKPQDYRIRKPTKDLITLAGGVVVLMLGTMALVNGFGAHNFQKASQKIRHLIQTPPISPGSSPKGLDKQSTFPLAREGLSLPQTARVQPQRAEKLGTPVATKINKDLGKAGKWQPPLSDSSEPRQTPVPPFGTSGSGRFWTCKCCPPVSLERQPPLPPRLQPRLPPACN
jgi:hypothetical protein